MMKPPRLLVLTLLALSAAGPAGAQFSRGVQRPTPAPSPSPTAAPTMPPAASAPALEDLRAGSILQNARLTDILRVETLALANPQDEGLRRQLMQLAWSADHRTVIVIGIGARHPVRFMQKRAAAADCARWFAYHQAWKKGLKHEPGSIHAQVRAPFSAILEEILPDGRMAVVRLYTFSD